MSMLSDLKTTIAALGYSVETGVFTDTAPDNYIVLVPLSDTFELHADDAPGADVQEVRLSIYTKGNYNTIKNAVVSALLTAGFTITARQYIGYETETGYHHYNVDAAQVYEMEEN